MPEGREAQLQHDWFHAGNGSPVAVDALRFGDVCFYGADARDVHHVTISWDGGKVLEAGKGTRAMTTIALAEAAGAMVMVPPSTAIPTSSTHLGPDIPGAPPARPSPPVADDWQAAALADASALRRYQWADRGKAPAAYIRGMAIAFGRARAMLSAAPPTGGDAAPWNGGRAALTISVSAAVAKSDRDVLSWYAPQLAAVGAKTGTPEERLVAMFAILTGLGMRESSGVHCTGADSEKDRGTATTPLNAEAGLFQISWDSIHGQPDRQALFDAFKGREDLLDVFAVNVACDDNNLHDHGDGEQALFQLTMKRCPLFAVLYVLLFIRSHCEAWGPLKRHEAEVRLDAVQLFESIAALA